MSNKEENLVEDNLSATWVLMTNQLGKKIPLNVSDLNKMGAGAIVGIEFLRDNRIDMVQYWAISCPKCGNIQITLARTERTKCKTCDSFFKVALKRKHTSTRVRGYFLTREEAEKWMNDIKRQSSLAHIEPANSLSSNLKS
jgi:hypothetical protein